MGSLKWNGDSVYDSVYEQTKEALETVGDKLAERARSHAPTRKIVQRQKRRMGAMPIAQRKLVIYDKSAEKILSDKQMVDLFTKETSTSSIGVRLQQAMHEMRQRAMEKEDIEEGRNFERDLGVLNEALQDHPINALELASILQDKRYEFRVAVPVKGTEKDSQPKYQLLDRVKGERDIARGLFQITGFDVVTTTDKKGNKTARQSQFVTTNLSNRVAVRDMGRGVGLHMLIPRMTIGGTLKRSIRSEGVEETDNGLEVVVRAHAPYAWYVETGKGRGPQQAFMYPALEEIRDDLPKLLAKKGKR